MSVGRILLVAGVGVVLCGFAAGMATQPRGPERRELPPPMHEGAGDVSPERVRGRLTRMRDRLDEAIAALDEGRPAREVLREVMHDQERLTRMGEPRRGPGRAAPPSDEPLDDNEASELVREHLPDLHARLESAESATPTLRASALGRIAVRVQHVLAETDGDDELRSLKLEELRAGAEVFDAVRRYRDAKKAGETEQASAREALVNAMGVQFDARHAVAQAELERLEQRVARMQADIDRMDARRSDEVERMLQRVDRVGDRPPGERRERRGPDERSRDG